VVVEGFNPQGIAGQDQLLVVLIPEGEGKDAIQLAQQGGEGLTAVAVVEVKPQQHLGIGVPPPGLGLEAIELAPKLLKVVDFAVKDQHHPAIVAGHGLVAQGGEVEDGQAGVAQAHFCLVVEVETGVVRATVGKEGCGLVEVIRGCFNILEKTDNTAHKIRKYIVELLPYKAKKAMKPSSSKLFRRFWRLTVVTYTK
jgi:hypothetical protein